jgi:hypothetical protein
VKSFFLVFVWPWLRCRAAGCTSAEPAPRELEHVHHISREGGKEKKKQVGMVVLQHDHCHPDDSRALGASHSADSFHRRHAFDEIIKTAVLFRPIPKQIRRGRFRKQRRRRRDQEDDRQSQSEWPGSCVHPARAGFIRAPSTPAFALDSGD